MKLLHPSAGSIGKRGTGAAEKTSELLAQVQYQGAAIPSCCPDWLEHIVFDWTCPWCNSRP
jgi:hypothetical protein